MAEKMDIKAKLRAQLKQDMASNGKRSSGTVNLPKDMDFFKVVKGKNKFDILPFINKNGDPAYKQEILMHYGVGPEEKGVICPKTVGKRCPICEQFAKLKNDPDADEKAVKALKPKERTLFNIVNKGEGAAEGVMVLEIARYNFTRVLLEELNTTDDESNLDFFDLENGKTLVVRFSETAMGSGKPFLEATRIDFYDRRQAYKPSILKDVVKLDEALTILPYDDIVKLMNGADDEDEDAGEKKASKKKPSRDEEDDTDADEEDEKPAKKSSKKPEVEDDDADEEEEQPKKPAKKASTEDEDDTDADEEDEAPKKPAKKAAVEDEEDADEEDEKPAKKPSKKPADDEDEDDKEEEASASKPAGKCPHGHTFGKDNIKMDECGECLKFDDCRAAKKKMAAK